MISKKVVKELLDQINGHSSKICMDISNLKNYPSTSQGIKLKEEIAIQNECIQDVLVSFSELFLS